MVQKANGGGHEAGGNTRSRMPLCPGPQPAPSFQDPRVRQGAGVGPDGHGKVLPWNRSDRNQHRFLKTEEGGADRAVSMLERIGLRVLALDGGSVRMVTHLSLDPRNVDLALESIEKEL